MESKTRKIIYWIATILIAFIFAGSGMFKLVGGDKTAEMAQGVGGAANLTLLGLTELAIAALWLVKRTGVAAALLAIAYMGGAMAVHLVSHQPIFVPAIIQIMIWIAAAFRFPELTKRLSGKLQ